MEKYVPVMIFVPLILLLSIMTVANYHMAILDIQRRVFEWVKNPFLAFVVSLVIAIVLAYGMLWAGSVILYSVGWGD